MQRTVVAESRSPMSRLSSILSCANSADRTIAPRRSVTEARFMTAERSPIRVPALSPQHVAFFEECLRPLQLTRLCAPAARAHSAHTPLPTARRSADAGPRAPVPATRRTAQGHRSGWPPGPGTSVPAPFPVRCPPARPGPAPPGRGLTPRRNCRDGAPRRPTRTGRARGGSAIVISHARRVAALEELTRTIQCSGVLGEPTPGVKAPGQRRR